MRGPPLSEGTRSPQRRRRWRRTLVLAIATWLLGSIAVGPFVCETVLAPRRRSFGEEGRRRAARLAEECGAQVSEVEVVAADGARLRASYFRPREPRGDAAILLHGVADNRMGVFSHAKVLLSSSCAVLAPDARAHGESEGSRATYGILETGDLRAWVDWLHANDPPRRLFGLGESMGAAILLQALKDETRFSAVVAEAPFASLREVSFDYIARPLGLGSWFGRTLLRPAVESAFVYARLRHGIDFSEASPEEAVRATKTRVLLVHGDADENIPPRHSVMLVQANPLLALWRVPGLAHTAVIGTSPDEFCRRMLECFGMK